MILTNMMDEELVKMVETNPKSTEMEKELASRIMRQYKVKEAYETWFEEISTIANLYSE